MNGALLRCLWNFEDYVLTAYRNMGYGSFEITSVEDEYRKYTLPTKHTVIVEFDGGFDTRLWDFRDLTRFEFELFVGDYCHEFTAYITSVTHSYFQGFLSWKLELTICDPTL